MPLPLVSGARGMVAQLLRRSRDHTGAIGSAWQVTRELEREFHAEAQRTLRVLAAAVDLFKDTTTSTPDVESEYDKLRRPAQRQIWPDNFGGPAAEVAADLAALCQARWRRMRPQPRSPHRPRKPCACQSPASRSYIGIFDEPHAELSSLKVGVALRHRSLIQRIPKDNEYLKTLAVTLPIGSGGWSPVPRSSGQKNGVRDLTAPSVRRCSGRGRPGSDNSSRSGRVIAAPRAGQLAVIDDVDAAYVARILAFSAANSSSVSRPWADGRSGERNREDADRWPGCP